MKGEVVEAASDAQAADVNGVIHCVGARGTTPTRTRIRISHKTKYS